MKRTKGFTLLELMIVVIIVGILATLGVSQYARATERARGAEARQVLSTVRSLAVAYSMDHEAYTGFDNTIAGIGTGVDQIPSACRPSHYFYYNVLGASATSVQMRAIRCTGGQGKPPSGATAGYLQLWINTDGTSEWTSNAGY